MRIFLRPDQADCILDCLQSWRRIFDDIRLADGHGTRLARRLARAQVTEIIEIIENAKPKKDTVT